MAVSLCNRNYPDTRARASFCQLCCTALHSRYTNTSPSSTRPGQGSDRIIPGKERREAVQFAVFWASQPDSVKKQVGLKHRRLHPESSTPPFLPNLSHGRLVSPLFYFDPLPLHSSANPIISLLLVLFLSFPSYFSSRCQMYPFFKISYLLSLLFFVFWSSSSISVPFFLLLLLPFHPHNCHSRFFLEQSYIQ